MKLVEWIDNYIKKNNIKKSNIRITNALIDIHVKYGNIVKAYLFSISYKG